MAFKQLSEYYSDDKLRRASITKELGTNHYIVQVISDSGSAFSASFITEEDAEGYAEEWVKG